MVRRGVSMNGFILLHRRVSIKEMEGISPTWVNVSNINTVAETSDGKGARITMRDGFLLVKEDVNAVMDKIRWATDDRVKVSLKQ